jgi:hypothetical protein
VNRIRSRAGKRRQARIGAPDRSLTPNADLAVVSELCSQARADRGSACGGRPDQAAGTRPRGRGAAGRDRGGAARQGGLPDRAGPPASRCGRAAAHAGAGAELHHRRGPGPADHPRSVAGSGRRSGGRDRADAGTAPGAGIIFLYGFKAARRAARATNTARSPLLPLALPQRRRRRRSAGAKVCNPGPLGMSKFHRYKWGVPAPAAGIVPGRSEPVKTVCERRTTASAELPSQRTRKDGLDDRTCPAKGIEPRSGAGTRVARVLTLKRQRQIQRQVSWP